MYLQIRCRANPITTEIHQVFFFFSAICYRFLEPLRIGLFGEHRIVSIRCLCFNVADSYILYAWILSDLTMSFDVEPVSFQMFFLTKVLIRI